MKKINLKIIFPLCSMILAAVFFYLGITKFGFWDPVKGPIGGFYPAIISAVLFVISLLAFMQSWKEAPPKIHFDDLKVLLSAILVLAGSYVFGMIGAVVIYLFVWMKFVEKESWKNTIILAVFVGGIAWLVFDMWLGVNFPKGIIATKLF